MGGCREAICPHQPACPDMKDEGWRQVCYQLVHVFQASPSLVRQGRSSHRRATADPELTLLHTLAHGNYQHCTPHLRQCEAGEAGEVARRQQQQRQRSSAIGRHRVQAAGRKGNTVASAMPCHACIMGITT